MVTEQQPDLPSAQSVPSGKGPRAQAIFVEIQQEWNKAEEAIKRSEQIALDVTIPAISELRYGGRRIVDALTLASEPGHDETKVLALLEDARFCCHRAQHDAIDAALAKIGIDLDDLTKRLGFEAVIKAYTPFREFYSEFAVARDKIATSRARREDRNAIYETVTAVNLPGLISHYEKVMAVRPLIKNYSLRMRLGSWNAMIITIATIAAMIFAGLAVPWDKYLPSGDPKPAASSTAAGRQSQDS